MAAKHRELVESARTRAAEYLLAAQQALDQPTTEDFMLIADGNDLNPAMLVRWQAYSDADAQGARPGLRPLARPGGLAAAGVRGPCGPDLIGQFATELQRQRYRRSRSTRSSPGPWPARPPGRWPSAAAVYGQLLDDVEQLWQDAEHRAALEGRMPGPLPVPALESLRQVFHGPDSPAEYRDASPTATWASCPTALRKPSCKSCVMPCKSG